MAAFCALAGAARCAAPALARVEKIAVHGRSLEGNLEGNSADRTVYVLLPPSYDKAKAHRYPVVYFLHGYQTDRRPDHGLGPDGETLRGGDGGDRA